MHQRNIIHLTKFCCPRYLNLSTFSSDKFSFTVLYFEFTALAQMVACLPLVQQVWGSIPGGVVNFNLKIFNLELEGVEMYTF